MPQKTKKCGQKGTVCFSAVELQKNVKSYEIVRKMLLRTTTAHRWRSSKKILGHCTRKNKSNHLEPHFPTSATKSRCLEDTKTAVALPHCSESIKESIVGWWTFGLEVRLDLCQKYGMSYTKKTEVEVIAGLSFDIDSATNCFFYGQCKTGDAGNMYPLVSATPL